MPKEPECVDCIIERIPRWRPTTGVRVKRCVTHVRAKKVSDKQRVQANRHRNTYGLSPDDVAELMAEQDGLCAVCGVVTGNRGASRALSTDHDHACCSGTTSCGQCVRGFLCGACNTYLGRIHDSLLVAAKLVMYIQDPPWQKILRRRRDEQGS